MIETLCWMLERMKVLVEPSGVAGAAAVRHRKADFSGERVGVILSGGNLDRDQARALLDDVGIGSHDVSIESADFRNTETRAFRRAPCLHLPLPRRLGPRFLDRAFELPSGGRIGAGCVASRGRAFPRRAGSARRSADRQVRPLLGRRGDVDRGPSRDRPCGIRADLFAGILPHRVPEQPNSDHARAGEVRKVSGRRRAGPGPGSSSREAASAESPARKSIRAAPSRSSQEMDRGKRVSTVSWVSLWSSLRNPVP